MDIQSGGPSQDSKLSRLVNPAKAGGKEGGGGGEEDKKCVGGAEVMPVEAPPQV